MRDYFDIALRLGIPVAIGVGTFAYATLKTAVRRWGTGPARQWPTTGAVIDVVSVSEQIREGNYGSVATTGYLATLTYFYRNPELQMGEFSRLFPLETAARHWAEGFKNKSVSVHVNPKDPTDSVLLGDDLDGLGNYVKPSVEDSLRLEGLPRLKPRYVILSGISEFVALVGLALSGVSVWMYANHQFSRWLGAPLILLLAFNSTTAWIVSYRADDSNRFQAMLHSYTLYCPAWMRWGVNISAALIFVAWFVEALRDLFPPQIQHALALGSGYLIFLFAIGVFFSTGATHAAVLRSQEVARTGLADGSVSAAEESNLC